jgi:hypothetical protein
MSIANAPMRLSWAELYQAALVENDREKLTGLVGAVESAIVRRRQELTSVEENDKECEAMVAAAENILKIKTEKLGWPPVTPNSAYSSRPDALDRSRRVESIHHWHR